MDFTSVFDGDVSWGKGYEVGFRAGWAAREELEESRRRWEDRGLDTDNTARSNPDHPGDPGTAVTAA